MPVALNKVKYGPGVKRMSGNVSTEARTALRSFLQGIIHDVVIITEHSRRQTATVMDVLLALKRRGRCARTATPIAPGLLAQSRDTTPLSVFLKQ